MDEKIYTIPVNEAFEEKGQCPFCAMRRSLEENAVAYMLGPSYMEDDIRMETNKTGFCKEHYLKLYQEQNRLGLALMVLTHLQQINKDLQKLQKELDVPTKRKLFSKQSNSTNGMISQLRSIEGACYICNRVDKTFKRYIDTFFYMWRKEDSIRTKVKNSNGFCLSHFAVLLDEGKKKLSPEAYNNFISTIVPIELNVLSELESDLDWFVQKFDYRNNEAPWKNSKDALVRALYKISSIDLDDSNL